MSDTLDLNKLADQLASGLAREQLGDESAEAAPGAAAGALSGAREAVPRGVNFDSHDIRLGDVLEHALLNAAATPDEVDAHCDAAMSARVATVVVSPYWVAHCAERLAESDVKVTSAVGFPFGMLPPAAKASQAALAFAHGATEVESIAPVGVLRSRDWRGLYDDVEAVVRAADGAQVTVTLETSRLTPMEMLRAAAIVGDAGADAVKAGTGFGQHGLARVEAVALLRLAVGDDLGVKAAAGDCTAAVAFRLISNGATSIAVNSLAALAQVTGRGPRPLHELMQATLAHSREQAPREAVQHPAPQSPPNNVPPRVTPAWGTSHSR
ncbi:MAG TPA: deoxyribose-phosphate aldolase [Gemmatimonadales bacterium]|nr:deoxyribose-phosphate aldolase [Gemmatimonadales bacterium]